PKRGNRVGDGLAAWTSEFDVKARLPFCAGLATTVEPTATGQRSQPVRAARDKQSASDHTGRRLRAELGPGDG
ncbi:MAG TPA: hypothetical protein VFF10_04455, partial [Trueperaceae bacterium]|nr:hypothetical protein [Trueperaceae bacterium]